MAIFETFTLLFKADSAQIKKEIDDVKKKTEELTNTSKDSEEQTTKTDNEFDKLSKTLAKVAATYFSAASIIGGFRSTLSDTSGLAQFSLETGINIQQLDAWGKRLGILEGMPLLSEIVYCLLLKISIPNHKLHSIIF